MSAHSQPRLTPEEYLELDRASEFRNEYYKGRMYAMSGGTFNHAGIIGNIVFALKTALKQRPCFVNPTEVRVRVSADGLYTYPDVSVVCGEPKFADDQKETLLNPALIVEVLSRTTEAYDRGFKFSQYRMVETLQEYALVSQTEPRVEWYRRQASGDWLLAEAVGMDAACRFESVDCVMALADVYDRVTFGGEETATRPSPATE